MNLSKILALALLSLMHLINHKAQSQIHKFAYISKGCGLNDSVPPHTKVAIQQTSEYYKRIVKNILFPSGLKPLVFSIFSTDDPNINFMLCGKDSSGTPYIILNENDLSSHQPYQIYAFMAHEIGHITYRHFDLNTKNKKSQELDADYYAGFQSAKMRLRNKSIEINIENILKGFENFTETSTHPPYDPDRKTSITNGWLDGADTSFSMESITGYNDSSKYAQFVTSAVTIEQITSKRKIPRYNVSIRIYSNLIEIPHDRILEIIDNVTYVFDPNTFKKRDMIITKYDQTNGYEASFTVYDSFPVTVIVRFSDESTHTFVQTFEIPKSK